MVLANYLLGIRTRSRTYTVHIGGPSFGIGLLRRAARYGDWRGDGGGAFALVRETATTCAPMKARCLGLGLGPRRLLGLRCARRAPQPPQRRPPTGSERRVQTEATAIPPAQRRPNFAPPPQFFPLRPARPPPPPPRRSFSRVGRGLIFYARPTRPPADRRGTAQQKIRRRRRARRG